MDRKTEIIVDNIKVCNVAYDIRLLYVVDGSCIIEDTDNTVTLGKTDIFAINSRAQITFEINTASMVAVIYFDYHKLCDVLQAPGIHLVVNSTESSDRQYAQLRTDIQNYLMAYSSENDRDPFQKDGYYALIIHDLVSDHLVVDKEDEHEKSTIERIEHYINANYQANISLNEIADRFFLSVSTASRLFLKSTGVHFVSYLKKVRLEHIRRELETTNKLITQIALDNGMSSPSALNKTFKAEYGITPSQYRERFGRKDIVIKENDTRTREKLFQILKEDKNSESENIQKLKRVIVDTGHMRTRRKHQAKVLNVGPPSVMSSALMQKHVLYLSQKLDIEYVRLWNIFSPEMMILSGTEEKYNFSFIDEVLDFCVDNRLKLFFDLGQRTDVVMASEKREVYNIGEKTAFESARAWEQELKAFLEHIKERYHENIVAEWIFELTFYLTEKPYYQAKDYNRMDVWRRGYQIIKESLPDVRIAGPGIPNILLLGDDPDKLTGEILSGKYAPDIFTTINFPYKKEKSFKDGSFMRFPYIKTGDRDSLKEETINVRKLLKEYDFKGSYWITEWGNSIANRNFVQDSCYRAAFIIDNILKTRTYVDAMGIFYASDQLNAFTDSIAILSGSAGLVTRSGIAKPAYYAYRFLNRLGNHLIAIGQNYIVTAENPSDLRILCFNKKELGYQYYLMEEDSYNPFELGKLFEDLDPVAMEMKLNIPDASGDFIVRQRILNENHGSILDKWRDFNCSEHLARTDVEYLQKVSVPENTMEVMKAVKGTLQLHFKMEPNELRLITVSKE